MQHVNVLVVFSSRGEWIERLALAAAVGAVQGHANIRLRCIEVADADIEFVPPRDSDADWADAILAGTNSGADGTANRLEQYFDSLSALPSRKKSAGKLGASFAEGPGVPSLQAAMQRAGLTMVEMISHPDPLTAARLQGRQVAEAVQTLLRRTGD